MLARITSFIIILSLIVCTSPAQVSIIAEPVSLKQKEGVYNFKNKITIGGELANASVKKVAEWLKEKLGVTGLPVFIVENTKTDISLSLLKHASGDRDNKEGYGLLTSVNDGVVITAKEPAGLFYG